MNYIVQQEVFILHMLLYIIYFIQLFVDSNKDDCIKWNNERENKYDEKILNEIINRFEYPNVNNRWDSPLFVVSPDNNKTRLCEPAPLPTIDINYDDLDNALLHAKAPKPNVATKNAPIIDSDFMKNLEEITKRINHTIISEMLVKGEGDVITIPNTKYKIIIQRKVSSVILQKWRKQFLLKCKDQGKMNDISSSYVDFINTQLS